MKYQTFWTILAGKTTVANPTKFLAVHGLLVSFILQHSVTYTILLITEKGIHSLRWKVRKR